MTSFYGIDSADSGSMFGSYLPSTSSSKGTSVASSLGDYSMIRNGTYKKLLSAYYDKNRQSEEVSAKQKTEKMNLVSAKESADGLNKAANELYKTEFTRDNIDTVRSSIKSFVDAYNSMIDKGSEVDNTRVLRNVLSMTGSTSVNAGLLSDAGITVGEGNKLSFDESKLEKVDMSVLKTLFSGRGSYMDRIAQRSGSVSIEAATKVAEGRSASAYTGSGMDYRQLNTGTLFEGIT